MIGFLQGQVLKSTPERLLLSVQGVGYNVHIPLSTFYEVERRESDTVELHIHTHVREQSFELFGFWTERERLLFEKLLGVSGIGPRLACVILSGMPPDELLAALASADSARLTRIPGVGKKTADRMALELKDKVQELAAELPERREEVTADRDLVLALVNLGYKTPEAERAVAQAREQQPDAAFHELLRISLSTLSRA